MLRFTLLAIGLAIALSACKTPYKAPLPLNGPIAYSCSDGTQLMADFVGDEARIAIVGGVSVVLPNAGTPEAPNYTNGRYTLRGRGAAANWLSPGHSFTACRGS
ncbi:MAG: hypothetical protein JNJ73_12730 [Hyphomonadaceae bacterium]|nr:hypothetical protein [Hyphomonadaceae bacterium]